MSIDFANDPVWSDITPIPQDDGPNPVVPISYYPSYRVATGYFRAIVARKEFSPRVLDLTDAILQDNPAHYTVWKYRQDTLMAINHDLEEELKYIDQMAEENPKNYQIWHHRQVVIEKLNDPSREIAFINASLAGDSKNYHAWTYRQWLVKHFSLWNREIIDMNRFLDEDVFNNSAWNQRYFVYSQRPEKWVPDEIHDEVKYTLMKIAIAPNNESAWSYLKG
ncbi:uncharacterized protein BJ171DRAFT_636392 [Polychytrium aggregatum]|uniref:uncharacterized protein n=1 Tax=Polychytrium aggregatum TaxID=110093 RepID=UPI0022FE31F4|nr:uncharacterized protein BJ171DRAFT_636392 [Polychytrium aggregatum]KAI9207929.1 hypothetical protein BJ171DRAFT_636392 [Polychytrium aggregatum]